MCRRVDGRLEIAGLGETTGEHGVTVCRVAVRCLTVGGWLLSRGYGREMGDRIGAVVGR